MSESKFSPSRSDKPLRLWPGAAAAVLMLLARFGLPLIAPSAGGAEMLIGVAGGLAIFVWWAMFSRARWSERLGAFALMAIALFAASRFVHESIAGGGMGMLLYLLAIPVLGLALVAGAAIGRPSSGGRRWSGLALGAAVACVALLAIRTDGVKGGDFELRWRWTSTPEERLLAETSREPLKPPSAPEENGRRIAALDPLRSEPDPAVTDQPVPPEVEASIAIDPFSAGPGTETEGLDASLREFASADWPGFRGPDRDGVVADAHIEVDWTASPPAELWRRRIGPGWSSFAVDGDRFYTQEQRGEEEIVACYSALDGEPVWLHSDAARFWESNGGPGPRATPTLSRGRVYTLGATGIVNALDARDGTLVWSRNAATDAETKAPYWGMSASPLAVEDLLIVAASGRLIAYELSTGTPRWLGPAGGVSYSSPHLMTIDGVAQIVLLRTGGAIAVSATDGELLWEHAWEGGAIVQPAMTADGDVLVSFNGMTGGQGLRRLSISRDKGGWSVLERWTSRGLKPYFNDFVVQQGHAYGFDGRILAAIDLSDGERAWKDGRYGQGQLVLLADQGLLLVLSEDGELALVRAQPDRFVELARIPALEGKTWNHPVVVGDLLLTRNGQEMAAFRLPVSRR